MATTPLNGPWMPGYGPALAPQITDLMKNDVTARQGVVDSLAPPALSNDIVMPSSTPQLSIPAEPLVWPSQTMGDQTKYQRLVNSGSGIDQLTRPVDANGMPTGEHLGWGAKLGAGILRAADIAGSVFNGTRALEAAIPGTTEHHQLLVRQAANNVATDQAQTMDAARVDDAQAQAQQRRALAVQEQAKADALTSPKPSNGALLYDKAGTPIGYQDGDGQMYGPDDPKLPQGVRDVIDAAGPKKTIEEQAFEHAMSGGASPMDALGQVYGAKNAKDAPMPQQYLDAIASGDTVKAALIRRVINDTSTQPKITVLNQGAANRAAAAGASAGPSLPENLSGGPDAILSKLEPGVAAQVKAIGEGRQAPPASRSKQGMAIMNAVNQAYPDYDATQFATYQKNRNEFISGTTGKAINSFNTALHHLDRLETNLPHNSGLPAWNWVANSAQDLTGSAANKPFEADATAVSDELGKAYKAGAVTDAEHTHWLKLLSRDASPDSQQANIKELRALLQGKLESYDQQWRAGMPKGVVRPMQIVAPNGSGTSSQVGFTVTAPDGSTHPFATQAEADTFKKLAGIK